MAGDDLAAVSKGPWTVQEDQVLVDYIAANGDGSWNYLARAAGLNRTGKSCRLRWLNYLRPDLRRGKLTAEEQDIILHLHSQWGNKWSKIAKHLPGRTDNEVKNFWRTKIEHKKRQRRQHMDGGIVITAAAGLCSSGGVDYDGGTPATTEGSGQGSSGGTTAAAPGVGDDVLFVTHDYGIVTHQPCRRRVDEGHLAGDQLQVHGGGGAAGSTCWSAADMDFVLPELLAASGENFWAIDDFWSTTQSCLGNTNNDHSYS